MYSPPAPDTKDCRLGVLFLLLWPDKILDRVLLLGAIPRELALERLGEMYLLVPPTY